jgi:hypothetical protein
MGPSRVREFEELVPLSVLFAGEDTENVTTH